MNKILFSTLVLFFCGQILAQSNEKKEVVTDKVNEFSNTSSRSGSALKLNVFASLLGYSQFCFEKPVSARRSIEFGLGIIGAGKNLYIVPHTISITRSSFGINYPSDHKNQFGGFFEFGYKFNKPFNLGAKSQSNSNKVISLEGLYIKPSFIVGAYSFNQFRDDSTNVTIRRHHSFATLLVNFGDQWVFNSRIVLEVYIGGGPEIDNVKAGDDLYGHPFVLVVAKDNPTVNFAVAAGFRFGFLLK